MFDTLEEIKTHCETEFPATATVLVTESQIAQSQVPPTRTYQFVLNVLPPSNGLAQAKTFGQLKLLFESVGFETKLYSGKIQGGGYHLELSVKDKRQQRYSLGEPVMFKANLSGPPLRFIVKSCQWDQVSKEFVYHIEKQDRSSGYRTVSESHLSKAD